VPAIVDGALVLGESEAIVEYLEEIAPTPPLLHGGAADRARQRMLARFHDLRLEPPLRALFAQVAPARRDAAAVAARLDEFGARLALLATLASPRPFLGGEALGLADLGYPCTLMLAARLHAAFGRPFARPASLAPWLDALARHPAVAPSLALCTRATDEWIAARLAG
jgi:glutathione S-transferase